VRQVEDMFDDPQVQAQGMIREFEHPLAGRYRGLASAYSFGAPEGDGGGDGTELTPEQQTRTAPVFGQHTDEVLARAGYGAAEIAALRAQGAVA
jgi:crotonobetainyl-CoA:carnitine CoA-transferase CaiB-like acyl-CoA transferase